MKEKYPNLLKMEKEYTSLQVWESIRECLRTTLSMVLENLLTKMENTMESLLMEFEWDWGLMFTTMEANTKENGKIIR